VLFGSLVRTAATSSAAVASTQEPKHLMTQISIKRILGVSRPCNRERGFTLMELLIVMSIMIILMLIAIPNFISMKAQADETSAIESLRAIYQAQIQYQTDFPASGFSCSLSSSRRQRQRRSTKRTGGTGSAGRSSNRTEIGLHLQCRQLHEGYGE
jgi:prepilin-type N-terminal cleavage/methylation domain-containing protein